MLPFVTRHSHLMALNSYGRRQLPFVRFEKLDLRSSFFKARTISRSFVSNQSYMSTPPNSPRRDSVPKSSGGTPRSPVLPITTSFYLQETLLPLDELGYRAAGVLPYYDDGGIRHILLGSEWRDGVEQVCFLAGKRDLTDRDAQHTAARELWEETGHLLHLPDVYYALRTAERRQVLWLHNAKLALHLLDVGNDERFRALPASYAQLAARPPDSDMNRLHWVATGQVRAALVDSKLQTDGAVLPLWSVACGALKNRLLAAFMHWPTVPPASPAVLSLTVGPDTPPGTPTKAQAQPPKSPPSEPLQPPQPSPQLSASESTKPNPARSKSEPKAPRPPRAKAETKLKPDAEVTWPELLQRADLYLKA